MTPRPVPGPIGPGRSLPGTPALVVGAVTVSLAGYLLLLTGRYSSNVLFWDQWDYLGPLFREHSLWELFRYRHGPHRQGVGYLLIAALYPITGWSVRAEALLGAALLVGCAVATLGVIHRCDRLRLVDVLVPLAFLTWTQWEIFAATTNIANGPAAVACVVAAGLSLAVSDLRLRLLLLVFLTFLATHTGFGLFAGIATPALLAWLAARDPPRRRAYGLALIGSLACLGVFLEGWRPEAAVDCFVFPDSQPSRYLYFPGLMVLFRGGASHVHAATLAGAAAVLVLLIAALVRSASRAPPPDGRSSSTLRWVGLHWLAFGLLFVLGAAYGRVCLGLPAALSSRYQPYVSVLLVGLHLVLRAPRPETSPSRGAGLARFGRPALSWGLIAALGIAEASGLGGAVAVSERFKRQKDAWARCYLEGYGLAECQSRFQVHPAPEAARVQEKLDFLQAHALNIFRPAGREPAPRALARRGVQ